MNTGLAELWRIVLYRVAPESLDERHLSYMLKKLLFFTDKCKLVLKIRKLQKNNAEKNDRSEKWKEKAYKTRKKDIYVCGGAGVQECDGRGDEKKQTKCHSRRRCFMIDPETDPWEHHNEYTRQICLKDKISNTSFQLKYQWKTLVCSWKVLTHCLVNIYDYILRKVTNLWQWKAINS